MVIDLLDSLIKNQKTFDILKEIFNNPKYYDKKTEDNINSIHLIQERVLILFLDSLYKYKIIIKDEKYFQEYLLNVEALFRKLDKVEDIKIGIVKIIIKSLSKQLMIKNLTEEEGQKIILNHIYDKFIKEGYYIYGVSKVEYLEIKNNGLKRKGEGRDVFELNSILSKYGFNILEDLENKISLTTNFSVACSSSINFPQYLFNLVCNNKLVNEKYDMGSYFTRDYRKSLNNVKRTLNSLMVSEDEKLRILEIFNILWDYYIHSSDNIYLVLIKRKDILEVKEEYKINKDLNLEDAVLNIFSAYDDYYEETEEIDRKKLCFIELPSYKEFAKRIKKKKRKKVEIVDDDFKFGNKYGKVSILIILGLLFTILGVILTIIFI